MAKITFDCEIETSGQEAEMVRQAIVAVLENTLDLSTYDYFVSSNIEW